MPICRVVPSGLDGHGLSVNSLVGWECLPAMPNLIGMETQWAFLGTQSIASGHNLTAATRDGRPNVPEQTEPFPFIIAWLHHSTSCSSFTRELGHSGSVMLSSIPRFGRQVPESPCSNDHQQLEQGQAESRDESSGSARRPITMPLLPPSPAASPCHRSSKIPTLARTSSPEHPTPACHSLPLASHSLGCSSTVTSMLECDLTPVRGGRESQCWRGWPA
jgi:hypothetical protein